MKNSGDLMRLCPCHSGIPYTSCCEPYHKGTPAPTAESLMRSRYAAYALHLVDYIISTTHPDNPSNAIPHDEWKRDILRFSQETSFDGLTILFVEQKENSAYVSFTAKLRRGNSNISFTERSFFVKKGGLWLYHSGVIQASNQRI